MRSGKVIRVLKRGKKLKSLMSNFKFSNEVWSLIPARSGSKRIKNKNLKKIGKLKFSCTCY